MQRNIVCTALTHAALNDLAACAYDDQNSYLQAPSSEKHYVICGQEFGLDNVGKHAIIVSTLHSGKSTGADYWWNILSSIEEMGSSS